MSTATLKQAGKIISVFEDISTERMQAILESGLLTDLRDGDISRIDRKKFRRDLALDPELLEFLRLISGEELVIDECDGTEILADADDVFAYIDFDFKNWNADEKGPPTKKTPVHVYEMERDGAFSQLFGSLSSDLGRLCLTQHQIKSFIQKYRNWLKTDGHGTFFLFRSNKHFFVADVFFCSDVRLGVNVDRFGDDGVWDAGFRRHFVVPRLA